MAQALTIYPNREEYYPRDSLEIEKAHLKEIRKPTYAVLSKKPFIPSQQVYFDKNYNNHINDEYQNNHVDHNQNNDVDYHQNNHIEEETFIVKSEYSAKGDSNAYGKTSNSYYPEHVFAHAHVQHNEKPFLIQVPNGPNHIRAVETIHTHIPESPSKPPPVYINHIFIKRIPSENKQMNMIQRMVSYIRSFG